MKHITRSVDDVPVIPPVIDRRCTPDQRTQWRGGRRDSDWVARPPDAWQRHVAEPAFWRQVLSTLHIFHF